MHSRFAFVGLLFVGVIGCAASSAPTEVTPSATVSPSASSAPAPTASATTTASPPPPVAAVDPNVCPLGKSDTWKTCVGKLVEIHGQTPKMVYQHPMMAPMSAPGGTPTMHQGYIEIGEGSQIIVLSREADKCSGAKRAKGSLRAIDLGGPDKTKESYRGWVIDDATVVCE